MLGHRVVTLHPAVHGGILARRDVPGDVADLAGARDRADRPRLRQPLPVRADRRPARRRVGRGDREDRRRRPRHAPRRREEPRARDPGLPAGRLRRRARRARATGDVSAETRRDARRPRVHDDRRLRRAVAGWLGGDRTSPRRSCRSSTTRASSAYGENPHQKAVYYAERGARTHLLARVEQLHGKPLSFNNLNDLSAARLLSIELDGPACVIVKHANPCGVGVAETIEEAYEKALAADPVSAYGGVVVLNRPGQRRARRAARGAVRRGAVRAGLRRRRDRGARAQEADARILNDMERRAFDPSERDLKRVLGGVLVQERDGEPDPLDEMDVVCGEVDAAVWDDLLFAWTVVKHVFSNAIVIARDGQTLGIGAGQMSRVDAVRIAVEKAREHGHSLEGAVLASDAFFPFADGACDRARGRRSARSSSRAARSATTRSSRPCGLPAPRWSSPAAGTSGTRPAAARALSRPRTCRSPRSRRCKDSLGTRSFGGVGSVRWPPIP